jgi:tripartite-type tricarboxylate transporter receptor subunit TctC
MSDMSKPLGKPLGRPLGMAFAVLAVMIAAAATALVHAESFPDRAVKIVVPYPPGGPSDTVMRVSTQKLAGNLGQTVIVENEPGAGGRVGGRTVARAAPDGHTLLSGGSNENAITPALYKTIDYDPVRDFVPVAAVATDSNAVVVNPAVPATTLAELVTYAKNNPGKLTSGSTLGIAPHVLLEFLRARTGIDIVFVPYKGAAPAMADVLANQIQLYASAKSVLLPQIKSGKLRALVVTSAERWPELPDVPTLRESGLDGYPTSLWFGLMAPAATSPGVIMKLNEAINAGVRAPETQAAILKLGLQPQTLSAQEFSAVLGKEVPLWQKVAREANISLD